MLNVLRRGRKNGFKYIIKRESDMMLGVVRRGKVLSVREKVSDLKLVVVRRGEKERC